MTDIVVIGPRSSGKSFLVSRLHYLSETKRLSPFDPIVFPKPTDGIADTGFKFRGSTCTFKELGGGGIKNWRNHATSALGIIYVFDAADLTVSATNLIWLNDLLTEKSVEQKPILIVLAKCDIPDAVQFDSIDKIIGFDRILNPARLSYLETSAISGVGLVELFKWVAAQHTAPA
jgi:GTPase SAR1 family protein